MSDDRFGDLILKVDTSEIEAEWKAAQARGVSIVDFYAGRLTHLYPDPEDTRRFLEEGRASWDEFDRRFEAYRPVGRSINGCE